MMSPATAAMLVALAEIEKEEKQQWAAHQKQGFRRSAPWSGARPIAQPLHPDISPATAAMLSALATIEQEDKQRRGLCRKRSAEQALAQTHVAKRLAAEPTAQAPPAPAEDTSSNDSTPEYQYVDTETADDSRMTEGETEREQDGPQASSSAGLQTDGPAPTYSTPSAAEQPLEDAASSDSGGADEAATATEEFAQLADGLPALGTDAEEPQQQHAQQDSQQQVEQGAAEHEACLDSYYDKYTVARMPCIRELPVSQHSASAPLSMICLTFNYLSARLTFSVCCYVCRSPCEGLSCRLLTRRPYTM